MATRTKKTDAGTAGGSSPFTAPFDLSALPDFSEMLERFSLPGMDLGALAEWQRKDMETLAEANRQAYEGIRKLVERRNEMVREMLAQWQDAFTGAGAKGAPALGTDVVQRGMQKAMTDFQELAALEAQMRTNTWKVVQDRLQENMASLQQLLAPKK